MSGQNQANQTGYMYNFGFFPDQGNNSNSLNVVPANQLALLTDVKIVNAQDQQVLTFQTDDNKWHNDNIEQIVAHENGPGNYNLTTIELGTGASVGSSSTAMAIGSTDVGSYVTSAVVTGDFGICISNLASTAAGGALVVGGLCNAAGGSVAIGNGVNVTGTSSIGIGSLAVMVSSNNALAIGQSTNATANNAIAIGGYQTAATSASGLGSMAIGNFAVAGGRGNVCIGAGGNALGDYCITIGPNYDGITTGASSGISNSISIGNNSMTPFGDYGISMGLNSQSSGIGSLCIGGTTGDNFTLGQYSLANSDFSLALGSACAVNGIGSIGIGNNVTVGVTGATPVGAIAIGQNSVVGGSADNAIAFGSSTNSATSGAMAIGPTGAQAFGVNSIAFGYQTIANNTSEVVIGDSAVASGAYGVVIGGNASSSSAGLDAVAIGGDASSGASVTASHGTAIQAGSVASGTNSIAFGFNSTASGGNSISLGQSCTSSAKDAFCIGDAMTAGATGAIVMGSGFSTNNGQNSMLFSTGPSYTNATQNTVIFNVPNDEVFRMCDPTVTANYIFNRVSGATGASTITLGPNDVIGGFYRLSNSGSVTVALPSGAQLDAAVPNHYIGMGFRCTIFCSNAGTIGSILGSSGITKIGTPVGASVVYLDFYKFGVAQYFVTIVSSV